MSKWKMVPTELAPEMRNKWFDGSYEDLIAAAPKWEPSEEDVERAIAAFYAHGVLEMRTATRAAILAAVGGTDEH